MEWVKRNLFLVVAGALALLAVGGAGFYFYTKLAADQDAEGKLSQARTALDELMAKYPFPDQENLKAAKEDQRRLLDFLVRSQKHLGIYFTNPVVSDVDFGAWLSQNLADLQRAAGDLKVTIPTNFAFGFSVQKQSLVFDRPSLSKVLSQLDDVKCLCNLLFQARINELISVQRAKVSTNDNAVDIASAQAGDYLEKGAFTTNPAPAAVISPYQLTFRCSSTELAAAMEGIARAPNGFNVKWVKVEPGEVPRDESEATTSVAPTPFYNRFRGMPPEMMRRYGLMGPYGGYYGRRPPPSPTPETPATETTQAKPTGVGVVLKDHLIKVALNIEVVKLVAGNEVRP